LVNAEVCRSWNQRDESDQHAVSQYLRFEPGRAVCVPDRVSAARQDNPDSDTVDTGMMDVGKNVAGSQAGNYLLGIFFQHSSILAG